jgi:hypothetical protein
MISTLRAQAESAPCRRPLREQPAGQAGRHHRTVHARYLPRDRHRYLSDQELLSSVRRTWSSPKKLVKGGFVAYLIELWDAMPYRCALAVQYVVADPETRRCAIIDPVLDFAHRWLLNGDQPVASVAAHIRTRCMSSQKVVDHVAGVSVAIEANKDICTIYLYRLKYSSRS